MHPSRWDLLLDQKPVPLIDHVIDEVARLFAADLKQWPLPLEELDAQSGASMAAQALAEKRPDDAVFREAFRLARMDLARELDAYDDYIRNQRWLESGLAATDRPMLLFLSRYVVEQLLGLSEATEGRVSRPKLLVLLDRTQRRVLPPGGDA